MPFWMSNIQLQQTVIVHRWKGWNAIKVHSLHHLGFRICPRTKRKCSLAQVSSKPHLSLAVGSRYYISSYIYFSLSSHFPNNWPIYLNAAVVRRRRKTHHRQTWRQRIWLVKHLNRKFLFQVPFMLLLVSYWQDHLIPTVKSKVIYKIFWYSMIFYSFA